MNRKQKAAAKGRNEVRKLLAGVVSNGGFGLIVWGAAAIYRRSPGVSYVLWIGVGVMLVMVSCAIVRYIEPEE